MNNSSARDVPDSELRFAGSEEYLEIVAAGGHGTSEEAEVTLLRLSACLGRTSNFDLLEVGVGTGWLLVEFARRGIRCSGIELNPIYREHAMRRASEHGAKIDIGLGSVETLDLGHHRYDAVVAVSVFEHVQDYRRGLANVYRALRPGGVLYFYSTNKFSLRSGEYPRVPLYGWLPNRMRYRLREKRQGHRIIESSGVDFNQFTYWGLRREFHRLGFRQVFDLLQFPAPAEVRSDGVLRRAALARGPLGVNPARVAALMFQGGTCFLCVK